MTYQLKPLNQQVMVLTGATSGIGLVTARRAAAAGVRLVLAARSGDALRQLTDELAGNGAEVAAVKADVGREEDVERIAREAIKRFGRIDTWVNNAGVSIYGRLTEVSIADQRQLFETNYWGIVYGSRIAVEHLRSEGGALINLGSVLSDRAVPLQGAYCASKHAVKGFTDALRMELEEREVPISVTLIKPAAIDTPYTEHAKNYMEEEPRNPPPVYAPELVADSILHSAHIPERDVYVGGGGRMISALGQNAPAVTDAVMEKMMFDWQKQDKPASNREQHSLYSAGEDLRERGNYSSFTRETSLYTKSSLHPLITGAIAVGAGLGIWTLMQNRRRPTTDDEVQESLQPQI